MTEFFRRFRDDESGAVTVDWVVLTASAMGLGLLVVSTIADGATDQSTALGANLSNASIIQINFD